MEATAATHPALSEDQIVSRLQALYDDLGHAPADAPCAWPVARIFNALLAEARATLTQDPIVMAMGSLRSGDKAGLVAAAPNAAVRALAGQVLAAMRGDAAR